MDESTSGDTRSADADSAESLDGSQEGALDIEAVEEVLAATGGQEAALKRVRFLARLMDEAVEVPGTNFKVGLDPILGILPGAGDAVSALISLYPVVEAYRMGAETSTLLKMLTFVGVDLTVGSIPVLGTLFDAVWKANEWNVGIIEDLVDAN